MPDPEKQREFAVDVVRRLRDAEFEAYWAGGCVRDQLLGRAPKDYDVATGAKPPEIQELFGHRRTLAVGAAFGVITVLGRSKAAGQIEVATFRRDDAYSDGRHPDSVTFSSAEEDASRRDFTINGLFYDPIQERVIDFVGGREDLRRGVIRAIGDPHERFAEDKLRMLRAVRFSAAFDFELEAETLAAVREMAGRITVVSPERIATEMRRILAEPGRVQAVRLFLETGLAAVLLPEIVSGDESRRFEHTLTVLGRLEVPGFPLALAALLIEFVGPDAIDEIGRRWRLSNKEIDRARWLVGNHAAILDAPSMRWSALQPVLIAEGIDDLLALNEAMTPGSGPVAHCRRLLEQAPEALNPRPLLTGDDLLAHGIPAGPHFRELLNRIRAAQLDRQIHTGEEALAMADRLWKEGLWKEEK